MGNWTITVHGTGAHHNGNATDAEVMGDAFVQRLLAAGQRVEAASFTSGSRIEYAVNLSHFAPDWEAINDDAAKLVEVLKEAATGKFGPHLKEMAERTLAHDSQFGR